MAITTSGNISIKETAGAANSIDTTVSSVVSGSLVTLGTNSIEYTDGRSGRRYKKILVASGGWD